MHLLVNTTFRCQLSCPYCLLPHIQINRTAPEHPWYEWASAFVHQVPQGSLIDFAGGDPLLFDGLALLFKELSEHGIRWAMTTNAIDTAGIDELLRVRPGHCALINVSDHPGNYDASANIVKLQSAYPVVFNRVDHPKAGKRHQGRISHVIPYQSWREGTELDGIRRHCDSGRRHWVADPSGDVFRCNPAMATAQAPIGNLFKRNIRTPEPVVCETGCSTCYTAQPGAWLVEMRPLPAKDACLGVRP